MLICSDQIIEEADFLAFQPAGDEEQPGLAQQRLDQAELVVEVEWACFDVRPVTGAL